MILNKFLQGQKRKYLLLLILKFSFPIVFSTFLFFVNEKVGKRFLIEIYIEVSFIFLISSKIKNKKLSYIISSFFLFVLNFQLLIFYFSNEFLSLQMVTNINSIEDISGNAKSYILGSLGTLFISLLPITPHSTSIWLDSSILLLCILSLFSGIYKYSPFYSLTVLTKNYFSYTKQKSISIQEAKSKFYRQNVPNYYVKDKNLPETPNIILIFTEGLSKNIISDERNITPNLRKLEDMSISFENYYNHTFATYMGLIGQLYSGYQQNNFDANSLISLQKVLHDVGYKTVFFNTEPNNSNFTTYLTNLEFDEIRTNLEFANSRSHSISDKNAYKLLFETYEELCTENKKPIFLCIYTFGTHASFNSPDLIFADGKSVLLNKFFNMDYWFGNFLKKLEATKYFDETLLFFTTDHATYRDKDFSDVFPDRKESMIDKIPFYIYYKNNTPQKIDVSGKNSLCLTPTILDYLDISHENYFLGTSLFNKDESDSNYFQSLATYYKTSINGITPLSNTEVSNFEKELFDYFLIKKANRTNNFDSIWATAEQNNYNIDVNLYNVAEQYENIRIAVWSIQNGQDDLHWFNFSTKNKSEIFKANVSLEKYITNGVYAIHFYGIKNNEEKFLVDTTCIVEF